MRSLTRTSAIGFVWLLAQSGAGRMIGFLSQLLLARLLLPSDFGIIALANSVMALTAALTGFGIDDVIQSRSRKISLWLGPAFWASLFFSLLGAAALLIASPIVAHIYKSPALIGLLAILAANLPLSALSSVPYAYLRSQLRFKFMASYGSAELFAIQLMIVLLAWRGLGAYSFVIPAPLAALVKAFVYWRVASPPVKLRIRRSQLKLLLRNGSAVFGQRLVTSFRENGDYMLLGVTASKSTVGLYYMAFKLAALPVYTLVSSMSGVLFPVFAQLKGEPRRQLAAAISASRVVASLAIPLSFLQAAVSGPLIHLCFGPKWVGAGSMLSILSVGLAFDVVPCIAGSLMSASGRFTAQWKWAIGSIPFFFLLIGVGCYVAGATGIAVGVSAFFAISAPSYSYYALRPFGCTWCDIAGIYLPPLICSSFAVGIGVILAALPPVNKGEVAMMVVICAFTAISYPLLVRLVSPVLAKDAMQRLNVLWSRAA